MHNLVSAGAALPIGHSGGRRSKRGVLLVGHVFAVEVISAAWPANVRSVSPVAASINGASFERIPQFLGVRLGHARFPKSENTMEGGSNRERNDLQ